MTNTIEIENLNISDLDIPTDETLQEVATACENIATSSESIATSCDNVATSCSDLAKDTTLQSTNTALGSLATDATLQATNTAIGSLMADNTGQDIKDSLDDIKSAVQGLGTALGSDKANIDGSNIVDDSAFRSAIGMPFNYVTKSATVTVPTSSSSYKDVCGGMALSKGLWLITYWAEFQENSTGTRIIVLSSSPNSNNDVINCSRLTAQNNTALFLTRFGNAVIFDGRATDYTIYLNACQNSGVSLSVRGSMRAIKLLG